MHDNVNHIIARNLESALFRLNCIQGILQQSRDSDNAEAISNIRKTLSEAYAILRTTQEKKDVTPRE